MRSWHDYNFATGKVRYYNELDSNNFNPKILEKDIFVTKAIRATMSVTTEEVRPIFCCGTCLSKAYGILKRMSEDADFKLLTPEEMSKSQRRKKLGKIREKIIEALFTNGFEDPDIKCSASDLL